MSFGLYCNCLVAYHYGEVLLPIRKFIGYKEDLLANDWKYVEYNKKWKPENGDRYYFIDCMNSCDYYTYTNDEIDKAFLIIGNCFKSEEEAKHMVEKLKIINRLRELSNINFGNDTSQLKYSIGYEIDTKKVYPNISRYTRIIPFEVYFATKEDCENAINEIGEENLKKYYFDVVE